MFQDATTSKSDGTCAKRKLQTPKKPAKRLKKDGNCDNHLVTGHVLSTNTAQPRVNKQTAVKRKSLPTNNHGKRLKLSKHNDHLPQDGSVSSNNTDKVDNIKRTISKPLNNNQKPPITNKKQKKHFFEDISINPLLRQRFFRAKKSGFQLTCSNTAHVPVSSVHGLDEVHNQLFQLCSGFTGMYIYIFSWVSLG